MKPREESLDWATLERALDYDPETGIFRWKQPRRRVKVGDITGTPDTHGHLGITLDGIRYSAHRLAWFYVHKVWPKDEIDHINRVKTDNRIANLREATHQQNMFNTDRRRNNLSGFKGVVRLRREKNNFMARIQVDGKTIFLGLFPTPEEAHAAYADASQRYHGKYGRSH